MHKRRKLTPEIRAVFREWMDNARKYGNGLPKVDYFGEGLQVQMAMVCNA